MLKCNYCGRLFKKSIESCPGCGAGQFEEVESVNNIVISNPPEGGYKIDLSSGLTEKIGIIICGFFCFVGLQLMVESIGSIFLGIYHMFSLDSEGKLCFRYCCLDF